MKKIVSVIMAMVTLALCFALCACGDKYSSNYSATVMAMTNTSNTATVSFSSFSGTYVMKLDNNGTDEVRISYKATLGKGSVKVYYDFNDEKTELFEIETGGNVNTKTEAFTGNKTIYIIIESSGKSNEGSFSFVLEKA